MSEPLLIEMGIGWIRDPNDRTKLSSATIKDYVAEIERLRARAGKPIADAPRDGEEQAFEIKFSARAFWDAESKRWVLSYPLNLEYLPSHSRYLGPVSIPAVVGGQNAPK